ncbi:DinB family protein [Peribacillus simplex]|uniref:DinB family protein n=1 Tax=Peribacillus simplex TaxID=1478 RepID=UPI002989EC21|nr:DinB family protein [Peribacillus simplex]MBX9955638.1 DinB family protein [Peribacillus simplex]
MIFDLRGELEMDTVTGILYSMVDGNYKRLKSIVANMSQEEIDYKGPDRKCNSTAQLLKHLAYVDLTWVYRIKDEVMPLDLEEKYGPMLDENNQLPQLKGISLDVLLNDYDDVINMIKSLCCQLTDKQLNQLVDYENGNEATIKWGIWHIADHNRYHQAHITQLRKWFSQN